MMHEIGLDEYKQKLLKLLIRFSEYCDSKNLRYSLAGGTLLGAIRHKGFIPWDDDIDICMPRPDYECFVNSAYEVFYNNDFEVKTGKNTPGFYYPFCKIVDLRSKVISAYTTEDDRLWIDIFPVDGLPDDLDEVDKLYKKIKKIRKILEHTHLPNKAQDGFSSKISNVFRLWKRKKAQIHGGFNCMKEIENISARYPYNQCDYVGAVTWGLYGIGERMRKDEFERYTTVEFEGHYFKAFSCWDSYLHGLYGNYMELPPENKRHTHKINAWYEE